MPDNPYLYHIRHNLPRLLALFDQDQTSKSCGMGDRFFWAWGLIDFANATYQGAANGLALIWKKHLWPYETDPDKFLLRIDSMFQGAAGLTREDGSLEEAFPREGSFCVTALVAFDLLCTIDLLEQDIDAPTRTRWRNIIQPMANFLIRHDETHGIISNHLATAVAALVRWHKLTGAPRARDKANVLLQRILDNQSPEGWFREYDGPDPGYQSLCTYYLADVHQQKPEWGVLEPLSSSIRFLWHFAHPDGTFGGVYGSRATRFYNPAGMEALADEIPEALALADHMAQSIMHNHVVTLSSIDEPNLVPWFNSYAIAATIYEQRKQNCQVPMTVPCMEKQTRQISFKSAGLLIDQGPEHYTIINTNKGGIVYHFQGNKLALCDVGVVVRHKNGALASTQVNASGNSVQWDDNITLTVQTRFCPMPKRLPGPAQFLVLRLMCITVFRFRGLKEGLKRLLVKMLITNKKPWPLRNTRRIILGRNLSIQDNTEHRKGYDKLDNPGIFVAIHMASQGYWQAQDEEFSPADQLTPCRDLNNTKKL